MAQDQEDGGFLCMDLGSDTESGEEEKKDKVPRDYQSQEDWEAQKASWKPIVEKGELYNEIELPLNNPTKQDYQKILHAIEQLYFYRRYEEAAKFASKALEGDMGEEWREAIESYRVRCQAKADAAASQTSNEKK